MGTKEKPTLTGEWRVPIYIMGSAVALAVYATIGYANIVNKLDSAMTTQQAQEWLDNAREANPTVNWPRIPSRKETSLPTMHREAIVARKE